MFSSRWLHRGRLSFTTRPTQPKLEYSFRRYVDQRKIIRSSSELFPFGHSTRKWHPENIEAVRKSVPRSANRVRRKKERIIFEWAAACSAPRICQVTEHGRTQFCRRKKNWYDTERSSVSRVFFGSIRTDNGMIFCFRLISTIMSRFHAEKHVWTLWTWCLRSTPYQIPLVSADKKKQFSNKMP